MTSSVCEDPTKKGQLDWTKRYNIIRGITRGVLYLHQDSRLRIIHRDLKAGNILLDVDMNPKVADFGMARIFGMDQSAANTKRITGTRGYMPPEYLMHGRFSTKSDVYSFGVLVLEIICGRNNRFVHQSDTTVENLVTYAWRLWRNKSLIDLVDPTISDNCQMEEVTRCIHIALLCVQHNPTDRPSLSTIHMMLTHNSLQLPDPQQPGFFYPNRRNQERDGLESIQSRNRVISHTINDVTVTDLDPR
ncbi:PREDICTED: cysteine-rich receptor-like protein kinase 14 [Camelina sativa]|uniref:Cysteine-rich receptor-like protein kinase 14 n=1 Tax=Camelina sativa TaxID=90675 RepID=A0ABM1QQM6_CAMSA|nr:PREDICTED: cysteine-rich receptor-like protein kinase 14 [Camelina sativa]